jgi:hypothetical protein
MPDKDKKGVTPTPDLPANATNVHAGSPNSDREYVNMIDAMNFAIGSGRNPLATKEGRAAYMTAKNKYGAQTANDLFSTISLFNQRGDMITKKPEERIAAFYNTTHNNDNVKNVVGAIKNFGTGVMPLYRNSPDIGLQQQAGNMAFYK